MTRIFSTRSNQVRRPLLVSAAALVWLMMTTLLAAQAPPQLPPRSNEPALNDLLRDLQAPQNNGTSPRTQEQPNSPLFPRQPTGEGQPSADDTQLPPRPTFDPLPPRGAVTPPRLGPPSDAVGSDPTQASPNVRRILEGEQVRRQPLPRIEVAAKVLRAGNPGKALLRIDSRYMMVSEGSRFRIGDVVLEVRRISLSGVEVLSSEDNQLMQLQ